MKKIITLFLLISSLISFTNLSKAGDCPSVVHIKRIGPGCDSLTVSLVFSMPCNGKCSNEPTTGSCRIPSSASTIVFDEHDGELAIPCCAADIKVRISGCGHNFQAPYVKGMNNGDNGVVVFIEENGDMRVNAKR